MSRKMYIVVVLLVVAIIFVMVKNMRAQVHVDSTGFDLMLSTLLSHSVDEISVDDAYSDSNALLLDTRSYDEYKVSHIQNSTWTGYESFDMAKMSGVDKSRKIIVYCSVGYRSEKIAEQLKAAGFTNVSNLYGGIFEWVNNGYPVYDLNGSATPQVHGYSQKWGVWLYKGEKVY